MELLHVEEMKVLNRSGLSSTPGRCGCGLVIPQAKVVTKAWLSIELLEERLGMSPLTDRLTISSPAEALGAYRERRASVT